MNTAGKEYSLDIINRCEPTEEGRKKQILGIDGMFSFTCSVSVALSSRGNGNA